MIYRKALVALSTCPLVILTFISNPFRNELIQPLIPISNLQHQQTLRPHIEQQIYNAQVRQKAVLLLKDLVIGFGRELRVFQSEVFLRMDAFAEIRFIRSEFSPVFGGACHIGLYVYQRTDKMAKFFVEID